MQVTVPLDAVTGVVRLVGDSNAASVVLQIVPRVDDVQVESISGDGQTATLLIAGLGFVEGGNSEYRFGTGAAGLVLFDAGASTGADVLNRNDAVLGFVANGYARVTVALSDGVFGPIAVKTAGGTSAAYSVSLSSITATALSGTPADATKASANAGQAITLVGAGLNTTTDVLLRWSDINGNAQMTRLQPTAAAADGTSATLVLPAYANGAYTLQVFGSASQPLLQIVPKLDRYDQQDRLVLFGSGFVEGASTYRLAGITVTDTPADASTNNINVYYDSSEQNRSAYLDRTALARYGLGGVTVSTAGGTSAALELNVLRPAVDQAEGGYLGDVAVDPASGELWVLDYRNPGHLQRIDTTSGQVLQTVTLTAAGYGTPYSYNYAGLQVLPAAMSLGGTAVPAGSLLVFNGYAGPRPGHGRQPGHGGGRREPGARAEPRPHRRALRPGEQALVRALASHQPDGRDRPGHGRPHRQRGRADQRPELGRPRARPERQRPVARQHQAGSVLVEVDRSGKELRRVDLADRASTATRSRASPSPQTAPCAWPPRRAWCTG